MMMAFLFSFCGDGNLMEEGMGFCFWGDGWGVWMRMLDGWMDGWLFWDLRWE